MESKDNFVDRGIFDFEKIEEEQKEEEIVNIKFTKKPSKYRLKSFDNSDNNLISKMFSEEKEEASLNEV